MSNERKHRTGVVYSTDPDFIYQESQQPEVETLAPSAQKLRVAMERAGRGGKTVTAIRGFVGGDDDLQLLARLLKQRCGVGGTAKNGEILIQGDYRMKVIDILHHEGYIQSK